MEVPKIKKSDLKKWIPVIIAGALIGLFAGLLKTIAFVIIVLVVAVLAAYKYYKIKKGEEIEPYGLMEKIKYAAGGSICAVIVFALVAGHYLVGVFLCFGISLMAYALIHAVRTDVLAMDN
ncbi:hypothetical protein LJC08_02685 [Methanimicrococcus sp. OttesenSCG-928-J09]|nr:hypothetical protein [Methanimicrococcus sp. OttesenSCG-928-J09]